ncbi:3-hydroxybenzoate 4-monooxygenase, partial [Pseudomonas sp. MOB-449]|nr:3-hydroxybenzoate 4-monooxygenase [Pseudomonas sp. MOB-449]
RNKAARRWRLDAGAAAPGPGDTASGAARLVEFLANADSSPVKQYTPAGADIDSVIDVYAVFQQQDLTIEALPDFLWPAKGKYGLRDYEKVFQTSAAHDIFAQRGIDRAQGCMVVVRP